MDDTPPDLAPEPEPLDLGAFSVSLAVTDLDASRRFYAALGFREVGGDPEAGWLMITNGATNLGLFAGMFERNILTFNPGLRGDHLPATDFTDVRVIQERLRAAGIDLVAEAEPGSTGPASITLLDPDGNAILIDQFLDAPDAG